MVSSPSMMATTTFSVRRRKGPVDHQLIAVGDAGTFHTVAAGADQEGARDVPNYSL